MYFSEVPFHLCGETRVVGVGGSLLIIALFDQFLILTRRKAEILPKVPDTLGLVIIAKSGCPVRSLLIEAIV